MILGRMYGTEKRQVRGSDRCQGAESPRHRLGSRVSAACFSQPVSGRASPGGSVDIAPPCLAGAGLVVLGVWGEHVELTWEREDSRGVRVGLCVCLGWNGLFYVCGDGREGWSVGLELQAAQPSHHD